MKFLGGACILWSLMTFISGSTSSFAVLFAARMLLGVFQSVNNPTSLTLLVDYFPERMRARVNGVQSSGIYIGGALSSLTVLAIRRFGWRYSFKGMGIVGLVVGIATLLFVKDPNCEKGVCNFGKDRPKIRETNLIKGFFAALTDLMKNKVTRYATLAGMANFMGGYCCMYFMPAFYQQVYPGFKLAFANLNALSLACMGFCSALLGGVISDKYSPKYPMTNAWIGIVSSLLVIPCDILAFTTTGSFWVSISFLAAKYLAGECWGSPQLSMM